MEKEYSGERFLPEECKGEMAIEHFQRYQFARCMVEGKVVLDSACGEGYGSSLLAEKASRVVGLDIDEQVVTKANEKYGNSNLSYVVGSVEKLPFDENMFDVVVSYETIEHVSTEMQESFLREIVRVLKPDGKLIMSTPNKAIYTDLVKGENQFHIKEFYVQEYKAFLGKTFKNMEIFCQYPNTGYFITRENEVIITKEQNVEPERSRYVIAVCSNETLDFEVDTKTFTRFDDSMYYFLNLQVHEFERKILREKEETDSFEKRQEQAIEEQKVYVSHLEHDIEKQKEYSSHLEHDIEEQKEYIAHLEKDIADLKKYIEEH